MLSATRTTTRLLEELADPAAEAVWTEFDTRYRPIIVAFARHLGLSVEDAADVAQETLASFVRAYRQGEYRRERGRLRSWLIGIAKRRIADQRRAVGGGGRREGGDSMLGTIPNLEDHDRLDALWESQRRACILRHALQEMRVRTRTDEKTIRAFELVVFTGRPGPRVAEELGMTVADVWAAKNRVAERLRVIVDELERLYDDRE